jgi:branched-chain amino acid transport system ATP-binding protein
VLVIEHDLDAIGALTDRVLLMDRGQIVADGQPQEILSSAAVLDVYLRADGQ